MATKFNPVMRNALNGIRGKVRRFTPEESFPSVDKWEADGVDHINIGYNVKTELGNLLSLDSPLKLRHPLFGHFETVENFRLYIQTEEKDDRLRYMRVVDARKVAKTYRYKRPINLNAIVMDAVFIRIKAYPSVAKMIVESSLPFENYYNHPKSGIRIRPRSFSWLIPGFEEIRKALKENREPDFSFLMDRPDTGIYDFVMPEKREIPDNTSPSKKIRNVLSSIKGGVKQKTSNEVEESGALTEAKFRKTRRNKKNASMNTKAEQTPDQINPTTEEQVSDQITPTTEEQVQEGTVGLTFDPADSGASIELSQEALKEAEEQAKKDTE